MRWKLLFVMVIVGSLAARTARAEDIAPPPPLPPAQVDVGDAHRWERAQFSGGRFVVELLAGAAVGSLVAIGTYNAAGGGIGGALAGLGANVVVTPLVEYGVGRAMGGQGTLGKTYLGATLGFGAGNGLDSVSPGASLAFGLTVMPILSALAFEVSSSGRARAWQMTHQLTATVTPLVGHDGLGGFAAAAAVRF